MSEVIQFVRPGSVDELLDTIREELFDDIVLVGFKGDDYIVYNTGMSRSKTVGALEIIKFDFLHSEE